MTASGHSFSDFLDILPAVLYEYVMHDDGRSELLYLSPSSRDILGHPPEYFMEDLERFWAMAHPDDLADFRSEDVRANRQGEMFISELRVRLPDGAERWLQLCSKPTPETRDGAPVWIGYIIDVTRLKQVEAELRAANAKLRDLSLTDGLTGLANRRRFDETLAIEWARFRRSGQPFALLLLDIDRFKNYNDHFGHQAGDDCLKAVADVLMQAARRPGDVAARYGGEELILVAPNAGVLDAGNMAEGIRQAVEDLELPNPDTASGRLTVSIGVAAIARDEFSDAEQLLSAADAALYQAKHDGRNCVRLAAANRPDGDGEPAV